MSDQSDKEELARKSILDCWRRESPQGRAEARKKRIAELQKLIKDGCLCIPEGTERISMGEYANEDLFTVVKIPGSVTEIEEGAFWNDSRLSEVIMGSGVRKIGKGAFLFSGCSSLVSITLPQGLGEIWDFFFSGCSSLQTVNFPSGFYYIHDIAFVGCTALRAIELPETLKYIGYCAFMECSALESIDIPDSVRSIGHFAFENCTSLRRVSMSRRLYSKIVKKQSDPFKGCSSLEAISLRGAEPENAPVPRPAEERSQAMSSVSPASSTSAPQQ